MRFLKTTIVWLLVVMVLCAVLVPESPDKAATIGWLGQSVFFVFGLLCLGYVLRFRAWLGRKPAAPALPVIEGKLVIVDGSNVMHWGGDPSMLVLVRVLHELRSRGFAPLVYFDANVGYKLFGRHIDSWDLARQLDLHPTQVTLAPSGTTADEVLLEQAVADGLRVVTNDRFLDWKQQYPKVGENGFLIKGKWKQGSVILLGLGRKTAKAA